MRISLIAALVIILSACTQADFQFLQQRAEEPPVSSESPFPETEPQAEEEESATIPVTETGAVFVPEERLLPTGMLEIGSQTAPLVLLLWTNHSCQYCADFRTTHLPRLIKDFVEKGQLRIQIAILPLKKYPQSRLLSAGLHCALRQNKGLAMHEAISLAPTPNLPNLLTQANTLGLDLKTFRTCLEEAPTQFLLDQQESLARSLDVTFVPTLFLNGEKHVGLPYYPDLRGMIEATLAD